MAFHDVSEIGERQLNRRIAVIDDERVIGLDILRRLERSGFRSIESFGSGENALRAFQLHPPELVISDDTISFENGLNAMDGSAEIRRRYHVPIIGIGASVGYWIAKDRTSSIDLALLKPFNTLDLVINVALLISMYYPMR